MNTAVPPIAASGETISAASGEASAVSAAVSSGPVMKISSISVESSAYAAWCSRGSSRSAHIERSTAEVGGVAAPAIRPKKTIATAGIPASALATIAPSDAAWMAASGTSTRRAPSRSTSRPANAAPSPDPAASDPDTPPAMANEPVLADRKSTSASELIPTGSRAIRPEMTSGRTCGVRRISP